MSMSMELRLVQVKFSATIAFILVATVFHTIVPVFCQNNFPVDPRDHTAYVNKFYLTSQTDCSDQLKNIYNYEADVLGFESGSTTNGPTSCTIRLVSESTFQGVYLRISIISMNIRDCRTQLTIYDGQTIQKIGSFDCHSSKNINRNSLTTSGDTVTFILSRESPDNFNFDIKINVKPIRSGVDPYDRYNPFSFQKFEQEAIVGMIGGFYALILIICFGIVCYFNMRYRGLNKNWETHQLATMKTDTTFDGRSQVSQPAWSVASQSRAPMSSYARSYATTTDPYPRKGAYPRSEDGSSVVYDHDEKFQQRNLMNERRDRQRGRDRMASHNNTYSDDEEDPDNFKEKVITSRVKTSNGARWKPRDRHQRDSPPSFEEATRSKYLERSSDEDEETEEESESSDNESTRKRLTTSSEGDDDSNDYTETESESESSRASSSRRGGARARRPKKSASKPRARAKRRRQSSTDDASSQRTSEPRRNDRRPHHSQQQPPVPGAVPYGAYPPPPGGQFVPVMAGHPSQFQPVPMMPPNYPPPQYPVDPSNQQPQGNVKPTEPPVYSYLVRRGYTPVDPNNPSNRRNSPAGSAASSQRGPPPLKEQPDTPLQSGVEYMRR